MSISVSPVILIGVLNFPISVFSSLSLAIELGFEFLISSDSFRFSILYQ